MPKFVIERAIPAIGNASQEDLYKIAVKSCSVLEALGTEIQWVESYVTDNKIYCVYIAPNAEIIKEHARRGGFPADSVSPVRAVIDPTTSEIPVRS